MDQIRPPEDPVDLANVSVGGDYSFVARIATAATSSPAFTGFGEAELESHA